MQYEIHIVNDTLFKFMDLNYFPLKLNLVLVKELTKNWIFLQDNTLDAYRRAYSETVLMISNPSEDVISVALGNWKYGYKAGREIKLSSVKYLSQRLLNYTHIFVSDSNYIFFINCSTKVAIK